MGIQGLLVYVKDKCRQVHLSEFCGESVAIDAYSWMYKGSFGTATEIITENNIDGLERYLSRRLAMLKSSGLKPIMVFDGRDLPLKKDVDEKRKISRETHLQRAFELLRIHGKNDQRVRSHFRAGFVVTYELVRLIIDFLRKEKVEYMVAPYEADAQLAFLSQSGLVDLVISEDSDLIPFECSRILYKLDDSGNGCLVEKQNFAAMSKLGEMYSMERFRWMCIMAGCDYFAGIQGIGLVKAKKILQQIKRKELKEVLRCVRIKLNGQSFSEDDFEYADLAFKHQVVYDPRCRKLRHLNQWQSCESSNGIERFGHLFDNQVAHQQAIGNYDYVHCRMERLKFEFWSETLLWSGETNMLDETTDIGNNCGEKREHFDKPVRRQENDSDGSKRSPSQASSSPVSSSNLIVSPKKKRLQRNISPVLICGAVLETHDRISFEPPIQLPHKPTSTLSCKTSPYFLANENEGSCKKRSSLFMDPDDHRPWKRESIFSKMPLRNLSEPTRPVGLSKTKISNHVYVKETNV